MKIKEQLLALTIYTDCRPVCVFERALNGTNEGLRCVENADIVQQNKKEVAE